MRTFRYSHRWPEGKIFDTTGETAPRPPSEADGWFDCPSKLRMTKEQLTDRMIDNAVRQALAEQGSDRDKLDAEHRRKYGEDAHVLATNAEVANVMDNKTPDGSGKIKPPRKSPTFTRPWER